MKHINITNFEGSITDWTKLNYIAGGMEDDVASLANQTGNKLSKDENGDWQIKDSNGDVIWPTPPTPPTPDDTVYLNYYDSQYGSYNYTLKDYTFTQEQTTNPATSSGDYVWSDGTDLFIGKSTSEQYIWNKTTKTWDQNPYTGMSNIISNRLMKIGNSIFFRKTSSIAYKYNKDTHTLTEYTLSGISLTTSNYLKVWSDGTNTYYGNGSKQYQLTVDDNNKVITATTYSGAIDNMDGQYVWTDGIDIYYRNTHKLINGVWTEQIISSVGTPRYLANYKGKIYNFRSSPIVEWDKTTESFIETSDTFTNVPAYAGGFWMWDEDDKLGCNTMFGKLASLL